MVTSEQLGQRLRDCRREQQLTLKALEALASVSATHISEIERGRTSPTIGALDKLARALGKRASFFLEEEPLDDVCHLPSGARRAVDLPWGGVALTRLTRRVPGALLSAHCYDLDPGAQGPELVQPGTDVYLLEQGRAEFEVEGECFALDAGDSIHIGSGRRYRFRNPGRGPARLLQFCGHRYDPARPVAAGSS